MQRLREAEKGTISKEYMDKQGTIVSGIIQTIERGNIFVEFYRATGILHMTEQIPGETLESR
jgi:N utilization substance protein A